MAAIRFEDVTKRYGATTALDRISFAVEAGEMSRRDRAGRRREDHGDQIGVRADRLDGGRIEVLGKDPIARASAPSPRSVGYLSQRFSLYGDLTIDENIAFFAEIHGMRPLPAGPRSAARDDAADAVP